MARNTGRGSRVAAQSPDRHMWVEAKSHGGDFDYRIGDTRWKRLRRWFSEWLASW